MRRQTVRTLVDLVADLNIRQVTDKEMQRLGAQYGFDDHKDLYGFYDYKKNTVFIRKNMDHADKIRTLLHELGHCYSNKILVVEGKKDLSEHEVESQAARWHKDLYGVK